MHVATCRGLALTLLLVGQGASLETLAAEPSERSVPPGLPQTYDVGGWHADCTPGPRTYECWLRRTVPDARSFELRLSRDRASLLQSACGAFEGWESRSFSRRNDIEGLSQEIAGAVWEGIRECNKGKTQDVENSDAIFSLFLYATK
jgi:hypothetical protein